MGRNRQLFFEIHIRKISFLDRKLENILTFQALNIPEKLSFLMIERKLGGKLKEKKQSCLRSMKIWTKFKMSSESNEQTCFATVIVNFIESGLRDGVNISCGKPINIKRIRQQTIHEIYLWNLL